ncbi:hypothetical protein SAMN02745885_01671 [Carboxydocella sporoproducens DSM 16521]|uniref:Carbohydrate-binding module family 96 domain-containing protein n=2 Tax=Carboxydocella TaxID=178898 RepID=A0A1T4QGY2_9FIRM|nr:MULTISPECIES: DNRLRE domain-containing protein [Carboxydocella]AVX21580.1 hypothetical protein CFE_2437 [Carboxydocella thermautotrophica]SKA02877.1 hypothetical protein SAMN02745885_01671 [Carboxydocella sporoproducens DSM 16521]
MQELISKRTRNSKHYLRPDGKIEAHIYSGDVHYHDGNSWQEIVGDWEYEPGFGHKVKRAGYNLRILPGYIRFGFAPKIYVDYRLPAGTRSISGRKLIITEAWSNADLEYTNGTTGIKADIVLKGPGHPAEFRIPAYPKGCNMVQFGQEIVFEAGGQLVGRIPAPFALDASGEVGPVTLQLDGNEIVLIPDASWLANATYPARIDPTTTLQPSSQDAYIWQRNSTTNYGATSIIRVGWNSAYGVPWRGLVQFDISGITGDITSATLSLYAYTVSGSQTVNLHKVTSAWSESTITWNTAPGFDSSVVTAKNISAVGWQDFDITVLVQGWKTNGNNFGVLLKQDTESNSNYCDFASKEYTTDTALRPKLIITYTTPSVDASINTTAATALAAVIAASANGGANIAGAAANLVAGALIPGISGNAGVVPGVAGAGALVNTVAASGQAEVIPGPGQAMINGFLPLNKAEAWVQGAIISALASSLAPAIIAFVPKKKSPAYSWREMLERHIYKELPDRYVAKELPSRYTWKELN